MLYETILNNKEYLKLADKIGKMKFITDGKWDWEHGIGHYKRVANYVKIILKQLDADGRTIELGMAAALLHDIGLSESGPNKIDHAKKSSEIFRKFLVGTDFTKEEEIILEHAISDHSKGKNLNSLVDVALVLADKLDVTYHRTIHSSIQDDVNKEFQKIKNVDICINDKNLIVKYEVDGVLNFSLLKEWKKMFTIPEKIAKNLNKDCIFMVNEKVVQP